MSQIFPQLNDGQVALSRTDNDTGIVLDELFQYAVNIDQSVYTIYNDLSEAIEDAKLIRKENPSIECYIHDRNQVLLYRFD
jgi:hypothetical protein